LRRSKPKEGQKGEEQRKFSSVVGIFDFDFDFIKREI